MLIVEMRFEIIAGSIIEKFLQLDSLTKDRMVGVYAMSLWLERECHLFYLHKSNLASGSTPPCHSWPRI